MHLESDSKGAIRIRPPESLIWVTFNPDTNIISASLIAEKVREIVEHYCEHVTMPRLPIHAWKDSRPAIDKREELAIKLCWENDYCRVSDFLNHTGRNCKQFERIDEDRPDPYRAIVDKVLAGLKSNP